MAAGFRGEASKPSGRRDSARPVSPERRPSKPRVVAEAPKEALPAEVRIETVDAERAGQRLDNFLSTRLKGVPKSAVYRVLRTGQVRVNGKRA
ncbi:MAG: hypothetical protein JNL89_17170, partial [Rhodanobacteraceae bacterium]|nr:hypothetical protein [Rhodanobacteraceae bacterium]